MKTTWKAYLAGAVLSVPGWAMAAGSITGNAAFTGTAPTPEKLKRSSDPACGKAELTDPSVLLTADGKGVQNVHVRLTGNVPAPAAGKGPTGPVILDQKECMYSPRIQGAVEGQPIAIRNSDGTLHNVHGYDGTKTLFNVAQPPRAGEVQKPAQGKGGDVLKFKCDVHPWMTSYVLLSKHPYFATTGADGKFTVKDVPPGSYTLEAWHEKLGTQTQQVTVVDGKPTTVSFTFAGK